MLSSMEGLFVPKAGAYDKLWQTFRLRTTPYSMKTPLLYAFVATAGAKAVPCPTAKRKTFGSSQKNTLEKQQWLNGKHLDLSGPNLIANEWTCYKSYNTLALVAPAFLSNSHHFDRPSHATKVNLAWAAWKVQPLSPSNLKPPHIRQRPCRASALCLVGPFLPPGILA